MGTVLQNAQSIVDCELNSKLFTVSSIDCELNSKLFTVSAGIQLLYKQQRQKTITRTCAHSEDSDQPAQMRRLI